MVLNVTPRTPDLEVRGSSLTRRVVSIDKELYSTLSLFTQVYKWVLATYCWEGNLVMDKHPIQGGVAIFLGTSCKGNRDKLWPFGPLARVHLSLSFFCVWCNACLQCTYLFYIYFL